MLNTTVALEAKLGFEASATFKLAFFATALRIAGTLDVGFMDHALFSGRPSGYPFLYL
ncbi:hypothetical protein G3O08_19855 [Cryomorpha ignava]|uniref:Uncharacterized protein n=1 Tax=Cryomorpha ignava TaxID=101383 RepID=A0A7K3WVL6_9FLAO|nr:hypothetical protein [Cryomorpha ignava]NEN25749.1 hypothetical protein [Cryomorpha ignava]